MICQIEGRLLAVKDGAAQVRAGDLTYEVLVPAADSMMLATSVGETVGFHTLHYLEAQGQGTSFWPRLIGFQSVRDREFFELFTTVKGIGNRRALRALQLPFARVAEAIAERDLDTLQTLPEIGKRTAEAICVELKGKIDPFVFSLRSGSGSGSSTNGAAPSRKTKRGSSASSSASASAATQAASPTEPANGRAGEVAPRSQLIVMANSAVEVLMQLGHSKPDARDLVEKVLSSDNVPASASEIVTAALK